MDKKTQFEEVSVAVNHSVLLPGTPNTMYKWMFGETTISYDKDLDSSN